MSKLTNYVNYVSAMKRCSGSILLSLEVSGRNPPQQSYTVVSKKKLTKLKPEIYVSCSLIFEGLYTLSITNFNYTAKYLSEQLL